MARFRKKPIAIEAEQFWPDKHWPDGVYELHGRFCMDTLEGAYNVSPGDWIITGIKGEKYPCKPDIFEMTYDPIDEEDTSVASNVDTE